MIKELTLENEELKGRLNDMTWYVIKDINEIETDCNCPSAYFKDDWKKYIKYTREEYISYIKSKKPLIIQKIKLNEERIKNLQQLFRN